VWGKQYLHPRGHIWHGVKQERPRGNSPAHPGALTKIGPPQSLPKGGPSPPPSRGKPPRNLTRKPQIPQQAPHLGRGKKPHTQKKPKGSQKGETTGSKLPKKGKPPFPIIIPGPNIKGSSSVPGPTRNSNPKNGSKKKITGQIQTTLDQHLYQMVLESHNSIRNTTLDRCVECF